MWLHTRSQHCWHGLFIEKSPVEMHHAAYGTSMMSLLILPRFFIQLTEKQSGSFSQSLAVAKKLLRSIVSFMMAWWVSYSLVVTLQHLSISPMAWNRGWVLALILNNLFFMCILSHAVNDSTHGVCQRYRLDDSIFYLRRLNARIRTPERLIMESMNFKPS